MAYSSQDIATAAGRALASLGKRSGTPFDVSEATLPAIDSAIEEASRYIDELPSDVLNELVRDFGSLVLEVGRRQFGGRYAWLDSSEEPVLITGEPDRHIAMASWSKVRGRLLGEAADSVSFLYSGFAKQAASSPVGTKILFV